MNILSSSLSIALCAAMFFTSGESATKVAIFFQNPHIFPHYFFALTIHKKDVPHYEAHP